MTQPAKVQEPSMEEILASIRRIIADDEAKPDEGAEAIGNGVTSTAFDSPPQRLPSSPARVHNLAAVAPQPAVVQPIQSRDAQPMVANVENATIAPPAPSFGSAAGANSSARHDEADVFDLTDEMALPGSGSSFRKVEPKDDLEFAEPRAASDRREPVRPAGPQPSADDILSNQTASAVESAFNSLASTVLSANSRTLEDLVKEMMRPMLKNWLDDNLPGLVERIVKTEIERVARGR